MMKRVHIFGASGSGTTTLGKALAEAVGCRHFDTDDYFWIQTNPPFRTIRDLGERQAMLRKDLEETDSWVLSGSLCGWGDFAIPMFDLAVFVWLPHGVRMKRLRDREIERFGSGVMDPNHPGYEHTKGFLGWAAAYDTAGLDMRSKAGHEKWIQQLPCPLLRLEGVYTVENNMAVVLKKVSLNRLAE